MPRNFLKFNLKKVTLISVPFIALLLAAAYFLGFIPWGRPSSKACRKDSDCAFVGCQCQCAGCGGVSFEDVVNRRSVLKWMSDHGCLKLFNKEIPICPQVCCPKAKAACVNSRCGVKFDEPSPGFSNEIKQISGLVVRVVSPSESGPLDAPKKFSFFVATDDGDEIEVYYFAYPPQPPEEGVLYDRPTIEFFREPVSVGDYLTAQGIYDKERKSLFVEEQRDYLKTHKGKP